MNVRLLVLDIDGTIAGQSNTVREPVRQAIGAVQEKGIQVALATGRMYHSALRFHASIGSALPLLAYNGAWIQHPLTGEVHQHWPVSPPLALELLDYFEGPDRRDRLEVHCYRDDRLYVRQVTPETERYVERSGVEPHAVGDLRSLLDSPATKLLAICPEVELIQSLQEDLRRRYPPAELHLTQSTEKYLEVTHPQANKGDATRYLAEEVLQLESSQVMAIGDNFNDVQMLQYAGFGIAMGNSPAAVREFADWVAPDVEEDGVAVAIEKFLLAGD